MRYLLHGNIVSDLVRNLQGRVTRTVVVAELCS